MASTARRASGEVRFMLAVLAGCLVAAAAEPGEDLASVCHAGPNSKNVLFFTSPTSVRQLIGQFRKRPEECASEYAPAFLELEGLVSEEQLADICSDAMYEKVRAYHAKFIHHYLPELERDQLLAAGKVPRAPIPRALRTFFILFAKQVNGACKQHLVAQLGALGEPAAAGAGSFMPTSEDFAVMARYKSGAEQLTSLRKLHKFGLGPYGRERARLFDQIQMVEPAASDARPQDEEAGARLYIQVPFDDQLRRVQTACRRRFAPVYNELFKPVIKLNNLGYADRSDNSRLEDQELEENKSITRWFDIIQACEVMRDLEIMHSTSTMSAIVGMVQKHSHLRTADAARGNQVRLLSAAEARHLHASNTKSLDVVEAAYEPEETHVAHQRLAFTPRMWLADPADIHRELRHFERDLEHYVWLRTSLIKAWLDDTKLLLKDFFRSNRNAIAKRDETAVLGRLTIFFERHRALLTGISLCLSMLFLGSMLFG